MRNWVLILILATSAASASVVDVTFNTGSSYEQMLTFEDASGRVFNLAAWSPGIGLRFEDVDSGEGLPFVSKDEVARRLTFELSDSAGPWVFSTGLWASPGGEAGDWASLSEFVAWGGAVVVDGVPVQIPEPSAGGLGASFFLVWRVTRIMRWRWRGWSLCS